MFVRAKQTATDTSFLIYCVGVGFLAHSGAEMAPGKLCVFVCLPKGEHPTLDSDHKGPSNHLQFQENFAFVPVY